MSTPDPISQPTQLLNEIEVSKLLAVSRKTLQSWRWRRIGPKFLKLNSAVRYRYADLMEYLERVTCPTSTD